MADYSTAKTDYVVASPLDSGAQAASATVGSDGAFNSSGVQKFLSQILIAVVRITILRRSLRNRAPIEDANGRGTRLK